MRFQSACTCFLFLSGQPQLPVCSVLDNLFESLGLYSYAPLCAAPPVSALLISATLFLSTMLCRRRGANIEPQRRSRRRTTIEPPRRPRRHLWRSTILRTAARPRLCPGPYLLNRRFSRRKRPFVRTFPTPLPRSICYSGVYNPDSRDENTID